MRLPDSINLTYVNLTRDLADRCHALELTAFPDANPDDLLDADDLRAYADTFPDGFFVCLDRDRVVGQAGGIFLNFDFDHPQHTIAEITGDHQCANHDPDGEWYYGTDIAVDPDYRRRGIGNHLYGLRKQVVRDHNRRGIVAGGYIHGFVDHKADMTAAEYVDKVSAGELYDATLTFQLENGFQARGVLEGYIEDEATNGWSALIVWENEEYQP
jgi:GNAT superfamily N-acetyltransferase